MVGKRILEAKESKLWWKENYELLKADNLYVKLEHALRFNGNERGMDTLQGILGAGFHRGNFKRQGVKKEKIS